MKKLVLYFNVLFDVICLISFVYADSGTPPETEWKSPLRGGFGYTYAHSVQQTTDGGYIVAGDNSGPGSWDIFLIKADSSGGEVWNKTFGGPSYDNAYSVRQTTDGGYIMTGVTGSFGAKAYDFFLIKADSSGNETWKKTFGGYNYDTAYSVQQTVDGGYIMTGYTNSFGAGNNDAWLVKTDSSGNETWNKTFGGSSNDAAYSVQQTADGGYIMTGYTDSFGAGNSDAWLIKTDSSGNETWNKTFGGSGSDTAYSVQQTTDGSYVMAATGSFGAGNNDAWLIKTDSSGNEMWNKTFGGSNFDTAVSVQQTVDSGYIMTGYTNSFGAGNKDAWLVKTDSSGNETWNKTFGGSDDDAASSVRQTADGGYIMAGYTGPVGTYPSESWLIKLAEVNEIIPPQANPPQNLEQPYEQRSLPDAHLHDLINNDHELDSNKSTIVIAHGINSGIDSWVRDMGKSIKSRLGSGLDNYNLAAWDWETEASAVWKEASIVRNEVSIVWNDSIIPWSNNFILKVADKQGELLAKALYSDEYDYTTNLHLIGHSAGANLIENAAHVLKDEGREIGQLTFLDPAFRKDASVASWADNYIGPQALLTLGAVNSSGAYDYFLTSRQILNHSYAHEFYNLTINGPSDGKIPEFFDDKGFYWSLAGGGVNDRPDRDGFGFQDADYISEEVVLPIITTIKTEVFDSVGKWLRSGVVKFQEGIAKLMTSSSAYLFSDLTIPEEANYFSFDFKFAQLGDGDYLTTHFNNNLLFWFDGTNFYGDDFWNSGFIGISPYAGQTGTLTFALNSIGEKNSQVWIDNLDFVHVASVPEPSSLLLLGFGLLGMIKFFRKK